MTFHLNVFHTIFFHVVFLFFPLFLPPSFLFSVSLFPSLSLLPLPPFCLPPLINYCFQFQQGSKVFLDLSYSPHNHLIVTGSADRHIRLWDHRTSGKLSLKPLTQFLMNNFLFGNNFYSHQRLKTFVKSFLLDVASSLWPSSQTLFTGIFWF